MPLSNTLARVATAVVLIPLVLALVLFAPQPAFVAVLAGLALVAVREYVGLAHAFEMAPLRLFTYWGVVVVVAWPLVAGSNWPLMTGSVFGLLSLIALSLAAAGWLPLKRTLPSASSSVLGLLYIGVPFAMIGALRTQPNGPLWVIYVLVLTWVSDTAAYFVGRAFGKRKLSPRVSPGKTWEGTVASLIAAVGAGVGYTVWLMPTYPLAWSIGTAAAINIAGQVGDLAESALKRGADVKDSGNLLPGHGGFLDRIDALLFAVPVLWYILSLRTEWFFSPLP